MPNQAPIFAKYSFKQLWQAATLADIDQQFLQTLASTDPQQHQALLHYRHQTQTFTPLQISELLLACAPILETFIVELFGIKKELEDHQHAQRGENPIFDFKKWFVQRRARRRLKKTAEIPTFTMLHAWLTTELAEFTTPDRLTADFELAIAELGNHYLADKDRYADEIEQLTHWCVRALTSSEGQAFVEGWVSFRLPEQVNHAHLVKTIPVTDDPVGRVEGELTTRRQRYDFKLTDPRMSRRAVLNEIKYCIYCHDHEGDFCSKGFPEKKGHPELGLKQDPLGNILTGCPLDEKISEMHSLKRDAYPIAALAMVMVDNPMCPATGHRICNDCMKGCIYQKQDPVNIPEIETRVLTDVLALPWGVEIYDLLTRWNPLRAQQYVVQPYNGLKVLVVGQGPAGFTLAHHLLMAGCAVVGVDGLKIEPLPEALLTAPIHDYETLVEALDERVLTGFGGVAEYGITVRWDKNFLKLIYLSLLRRPHYQVFGNIRFGGTLEVEDAWALGFDHLSIAAGAGLPQALPISGSLAPGMRQANDFLMALQLTGAGKADSLANLQVRLPAVVIGGGLTGIDTATEVQTYYLVQIEKILTRYEILCAAIGKSAIEARLNPQDQAILQEFLTHAVALRQEKARAAAAGEVPNVQQLLRDWGGVTVAYRRSLAESPAYIRNHEEVTKALEEGIFYAAGLEPKATQLDAYGHVSGLICYRRERDVEGGWQHSATEVTLPAKAIFVATGAKPNVAYEFEHRGHFERQGVFQYQPHVAIAAQLQAVNIAEHCKQTEFGAFTSYAKDDRRISFIGDTHPVFHGSVVKAIASGLRAYPHILASLEARQPEQGALAEYTEFRNKIAHLLTARLVKMQRRANEVLELQIQAPMVARKYQPGQFVRVQNYETTAPRLNGLSLQTEGMALLSTAVDREQGLLTVMVLEKGISSRLCQYFTVGEPLAVMGPTGAKASLPKQGGHTLLVVGGHLAAATVRSLAPVLHERGCQLLYIGCFDAAAEIYQQTDLEAAADAIVWVTRQGESVTVNRPQDSAMTGEVGLALAQYASGELFETGTPPLALQQVTRLMIVGGTPLIRAVQQARQTLADYWHPELNATASVYSTMQCMLKGVCAQCLQWQIDPATGQRTKAVFACSWQDQPVDIIDLDNLDERLSQNRLQEQLGALWLSHLCG